jgi:cell division protein ZapA
MEDGIFSIQLKIVDTYFAYTCKRKEEQNARKAATNVTNKYMAYSSHYLDSKYSMMDVLKLVAFHFSMELLEDTQREDMTPFVAKIEQLNNELEQYIEAL